MTATAISASSRFGNVHPWMLLPFAISLLGFSYSYDLNLPNATFHHHVHGLSATLWYILVAVQPSLVVRKGDLRRHGSPGVPGLSLADIVAGSALAIIPKNIEDVATLEAKGLFTQTFAYFATLIDVVLVSMFIVSVGLAVLNIRRKALEDYVQWLMASVLFVLFRGLARLVGVGGIVANAGNMEGVSLAKLAVSTMAVMMSRIRPAVFT